MNDAMPQPSHSGFWIGLGLCFVATPAVGIPVGVVVFVIESMAYQKALNKWVAENPESD